MAEKTFNQVMLEIQNLELNVVKETKGYNYKYADLEAVWKVLRPELEKRGVLVEQFTTQAEEQYVLETIVSVPGLQDTSRSVMPLLGVKDMQSLGSAITYARRYAVLTMFNIITEDDDGAAAKQKEATAPRGNVTSAQLKKMDDILELKGIAKESRKKVIEVITGGMSARELTVTDASKVITELNDLDEETLVNMAKDEPF